MGGCEGRTASPDFEQQKKVAESTDDLVKGSLRTKDDVEEDEVEDDEEEDEPEARAVPSKLKRKVWCPASL